MNNKEIPLVPGNIYHVFNHANGSENLFKSRDNFLYFLQLYAKRIQPLAKTFAYCLMPNHIHFAVQIKSKFELMLEWENRFKDSEENGTTPPKLINDFPEYVSQRFGKFFQSYSQAFNRQQNRMGSLFIPNFKRKPVTGKIHLNQNVHYIHSNPVHHGFTKAMLDWEFSSIHAYWLDKQTKLAKGEVLEDFGGLEKFKSIHQNSLDLNMDFEF